MEDSLTRSRGEDHQPGGGKGGGIVGLAGEGGVAEAGEGLQLFNREEGQLDASTFAQAELLVNLSVENTLL